MRALPLAALLLLPLAHAASPAATADVTISGLAFNPATVAVDVGDSVRWSNQDAVFHTSTSDDGTTWDTGSIAGGSSATVRMPAVGTFAYHCDIHPFMKGKVLVGDPAGLADLIVTDLVVSDTTPVVAKQVDVTVRNQGVNTAPASKVHVSYLYHGTLHAIADADVPQLGPLGDEATVSVTWTTLGKVGDFVVDAEADGAHAVPESDEDNNHAQTTTSVLLSGVPGVDLLEP